MRLPLSQRWRQFAAVVLLSVVGLPSIAFAKDFDGLWSVSIVAEDDTCPSQTIPVEVSNSTISFSAFGATGTGEVARSGAIRINITVNEKVVRIKGQAHGRVASGRWRMAPSGCEGRWSAQIAE